VIGTSTDARPAIVGTPAYLPPEAYQGAGPDRSFDLWALAVVLLEAAIGANPFVWGASGGEIGPRVRRAAPALAGFFERALAHDPRRRFETAVQMQAALERVTAAATGSSTPFDA
jgi:serine/threonine protein kinase